jgi:hypothetical protein
MPPICRSTEQIGGYVARQLRRWVRILGDGRANPRRHASAVADDVFDEGPRDSDEDSLLTALSAANRNWR